jgi:hypothetical protein
VRELLQDARFALRRLRKNPAYTVAATVMLAVAICANGTVFSWIDGTMLHPIPGARDMRSLVSVMPGSGVSPRLRHSHISTTAICGTRITASRESSGITTIGLR